VNAPGRPLGAAATAAVITGLGFAVSLAGDAAHVASGTTVYEWEDVPEIWRSAIWFPFMVSGAVLLAALAGGRAGLPGARVRNRADAVAGAAAIAALYALTAALRGEPATVSVLLTGAIAVLVWCWWDPSPGSFAIAIAAAVLGPLAEIAIVEIGAAGYTPGSDGLGGVAPWLPCLYFAAGAVASGLWAAIARDGAPKGA
jgi:hypothetical protein